MKDYQIIPDAVEEKDLEVTIEIFLKEFQQGTKAAGSATWTQFAGKPGASAPSAGWLFGLSRKKSWNVHWTSLSSLSVDPCDDDDKNCKLIFIC